MPSITVSYIHQNGETAADIGAKVRGLLSDESLRTQAEAANQLSFSPDPEWRTDTDQVGVVTTTARLPYKIGELLPPKPVVPVAEPVVKKRRKLFANGKSNKGA